jgi:cytochrome c oxidase cbb3-type subunit IV
MDPGTWRGIFTAVMLLLFVAICFWAFSSKRNKDFEEAAKLPLEADGERIPGGSAAQDHERSNAK